MFRYLTLLPLGSAMLATVVPVTAPQSQIQNGRVETRQATAIASEVSALGGGADPVWIGWRVPAIDGDRDRCAWNSFSNGTILRGDFLDSTVMTTPRPQVQAPSGPIAMEGGTSIVVLLRVVDRKIERLRTVGDDCPLDAGGRAVYWLNGITPSESLKYLDGLMSQDGVPPAAQRTLVNNAIAAISTHRDAGADAILDRLVAGRDADIRRLAAQRLGADRGAHGFEVLRRLVATETGADQRLSFVRALGQTRQPQTADALLALAKSDADPKVRAEAANLYPQRAGVAGIDATLAIAANDPEDTVKTRAVLGLSRLPADAIVPRLIDLARTSKSLPVRKQAVSVLAETKDPRAINFLAEILTR
jgi:hypothetical protein